MVINGGSLNGGNASRGRVENDFYATDKKDTRNFLDTLLKDNINLDGLSLLEPSAGQGHIVDVLKEYFPNSNIDYSDLISRREDVLGGVDFLTSDFNNYDVVITNPPFKFAKEFIDKSLQISNKYVMMFVKLQFLEGKSRVDWWERIPLEYVYVYSYRANPLRDGMDRDENGKKWSTTIAFAWFVINKDYKGEPKIRWIKDLTGGK